ncbi:DUF262 domain-containing protein [uncultured Maribacter sp.]|uniref:DUF262 domain-containing protein n=1 Tax=uncultured Maribacter sp. TaxID=431308 RepID=UPI002602383D|nr:DUF262 domain-containing protein [uncultured Maribacter sp.]
MFQRLEISPIGKATIKNICELFEQDQIDVTPDYQRMGHLWKPEKKQLLIDSIINDYDIPKIYFHYLNSNGNQINDSGKLLAVIDGKQRTEAFYEFLNNDLKLSKNFVFLEDPSIDLKDKKFDFIKKEYPSIAYKIESYKLDLVFIDTDEKERIEDLFLRLNEGLPLNNAERRKAIQGYSVNKILTDITQNPFFVDKVSFKNNRLEHFDLYTKLLLIEHNDDIKSFTKSNLDSLLKENKTQNQEIDTTFNELQNRLALLSQHFNNKDPLLKSKSIVPLFYLFLEPNSQSINEQIEFLREFTELRKENRKDQSNKIFIEFDRLNQQGAHQKTSLEKRLLILKRYLEVYKNGDLSMKSKIKTEGLGLRKNIEDI